MGTNGPPPKGPKPAAPPPPPPKQPPPVVMISTPQLSPEREANLRAQFEQAQQSGKTVILPAGFKLTQLEPGRPRLPCDYCDTPHSDPSCPSCGAPPATRTVDPSNDPALTTEPQIIEA